MKPHEIAALGLLVDAISAHDAYTVANIINEHRSLIRETFMVKMSREGNDFRWTLLVRPPDMAGGILRGCTLLHVAAFVGDIPIAQMLINAGARVNQPRDGNVTPIEDAIRHRWPELLYVFLAAGADVTTAKKQKGVTLDTIAAAKDRKHPREEVYYADSALDHFIKMLRDAEPGTDVGPVFACIQLLLDNGANTEHAVMLLEYIPREWANHVRAMIVNQRAPKRRFPWSR